MTEDQLADKMPITKKAGIISVMILAFFAYFISESLLRQAAVSNINPQSVNVEGLLTKLPSSMRDSVNQKIETTRLRNAIRDAKTDADKVQAISSLADFTKEPGQRDWLYASVLKEYPSQPESYRAYAAFLMSNGAVQVSVQDYHRFVSLFDSMTAYNAWIAGMNKLILARVSLDDQIKFLSPLLDETPSYRDYSRLYQEIAKIATSLKKEDLAEQADSLANFCKGLPTIDETVKKRAEAAKAAAQQKGK